MPDRSLKSSHTTNGELVGLGPWDVGMGVGRDLSANYEGLGLQVRVPLERLGFTEDLLIRGYAGVTRVSLSSSPQPVQVSWVDLGSRTYLAWAPWE